MCSLLPGNLITSAKDVIFSVSLSVGLSVCQGDHAVVKRRWGLVACVKETPLTCLCRILERKTAVLWVCMF